MPPPAVEQPWVLPRVLQNFKLARETSPCGALRAEPAAVSYAKLTGNEYSPAQAALIWEPNESWFPRDSYLANKRWGPVASYSVNRNSLPAKRSDVCQGAVGLYGVLFRLSAQRVWQSKGRYRVGVRPAQGGPLCRAFRRRRRHDA